MSLNPAYDLANRHAIDLARVEAGSVAKVTSFLGKLEGELVTILNENKGLTTGQQAKLATIQQAAAQAIGKTYGNIQGDMDLDLKGVAKAGSKVATNMVNGIVGVDVAGAVLTESQLTAIVNDKVVFGHSSGSWWQGQQEGMKSKFAAQIQQGYALGEDIDQITRRIRGTKANGYNDGVMAVSKREAEALVRSSVQTISNTARLESFKKMGDVVKGIEWVSTLDTRTTPICKALDGLRWTMELKPVGHAKVFPGPTAHWNCRSTQVPVLYSWDELAGKKLKTLDGATMEERIKQKLAAKGWDSAKIAKAQVNARASMDGQVSVKNHTDEWLKTKSPQFVKDQLGPTRAKLFEEGTITVRDLTDQQNRPLSVQQLLTAIEAGTVPAETEGYDFAPFDKALLTKPKADALKAKDEAAAAKITSVTENPKELGNSILATMIAKVQKDEPSLNASELLAKAETLAAEKIAANTKSSTLSKAKKNILAGKAPTPAQQAVIDQLGEDEKAAFDEATSDALKIKNQADATAKADALKAKVDAILKKNPQADAYTAELTEALFSMGGTPELQAAAQDVENYVVGQMAEKKAEAKVMAWALGDSYKAKALDKVQAAGGWENNQQLADLMEKQLKTDVLDAITGDTQAAAKKAVKAITGMNGPSPKGLEKWMEHNGVSPEELMAQFTGVKAEKLQQSVLSSTLSKAKKKVADGEAPTPAQQAALDGLTPEEKAIFDQDVATLKKANQPVVNEQLTNAAVKSAQDAARASEAAAAATTASEAQAAAQASQRAAKATKPVVPHPDDLKIIGNLGGSTGAKLAEDKDGNKFVVKRGAAPDHVRVEQQADDLYRAFGMAVPDGNLFETKDGPVKVTKFIEGKTLGQLTGPARAKAVKELQKGFAVDAFMANWDVAGTGLDNVLVTPDGKVYRIDNGGSLQYRAQGSLEGKNFNRFPDELFTMRDKSNISGPLFGDLDIYGVARQIEGIPFDAIDDVDLPPATKAILQARVKEMQHLSRRAIDFQSGGYLATHGEGVTRATLDIRQAGVSDSMPKVLKVTNAVDIKDPTTGRTFGNLRSSNNAQNLPVVSKVEGDVFSDDILLATKALASCANSKKELGAGSATGKYLAAASHRPALKALVAQGGEKAEMAKQYLAQIDAMEAIMKKGGIPDKSPPMFAPMKPAVTAQPTVQNAKSVVKQWEAIMAAEGINTQPITDWLESQSGNSWSTKTQAMKVAFAKSFADPEKEFYWDGNGIKASWTSAQKHYQAAVKLAGGEDKMKRLMTSWQAVTQEIMSEIDSPWVDRDRRAVLLYRTVNVMELDGSTTPPPLNPKWDGKDQRSKYLDGEFVPMRGTTESHSIYKTTSIKGNITTVQAVPFSRVLSTYWTEKPGANGGSGFLGDGEAEFAANTSGIPALKVTNYTPPAFDEKSKNATTWGVPLNHLP